MAFTVEDFQDLLHLLEERPEWRSELRRVVLTENLLALPEAQQRTEQRLGRLEEAVLELIEAQRRTEARVEELAEAQQRTEARVAELAEAQQRTEQRLDRLEEVLLRMIETQQRTQEELSTFRRETVQWMEKTGDDLGRVKGITLELRHIMRPFAYYNRIIQRTKRVPDQELDDMLTSAVERGELTDEELVDIASADVIVAGRRRSTGERVYLVSEVSWGVGIGDVERAARRAAALAKLGTPTLPVAAGEWVSGEAAEEAAHRKVWLVQNGRTTAPEEI